MKILYCYSTELGLELNAWLNQVDCKVFEYMGEFPDDYDLGVSFLYTNKIPREQIDAHPWINFHPGPLPKMRGRNLAYHAIMNGAKEFGATLHFMDYGFDTGPIIEVRRFQILDTYTAGDLVSIAHRLLADMFYEYIPRFAAGEKVPATPQIDGGAYYFKQKIDDEINLLQAQERKVRALTVPGRYYARVMIGGTTYRLIPEVEQ